MAIGSIIAVPRLREILFYDPSTGGFRWLERKQGRRAKVGSVKRDGIRIKIDYRGYGAHILAWAWVTGEWPEGEIDHINNISTDNRWVNLREATHTENNRNKDFLNLLGKSGLIGASFHKGSGLWRATLKHKTIGYFRTAEEAHEAYKKAALELYGDFVHESLKPQDQ